MRRTLAALAAGAALLGCQTLDGAQLYREGTAALERGDAGEAVSRLEAAAERVPQASEVHNHLGLAYLAAGRPEAAFVAFARAVDLDCDNAAARRNLEQLRAGLLVP